jgi:hypothetical protein
MPTIRQWGQSVAQLGQTEKIFVGLRRGNTTPVLGASTPTIQMLRQGVSTWSTITPSWQEAGNGVYLLGLTPSMKRTAGSLLIYIKSAATPTIDSSFRVTVGVNPQDEAGNVARIRHIQRRMI